MNRVYLPSSTEPPKRLDFYVASVGEELPIHHGVHEPLPVLFGHVRDEPWVPFTMEADLLRETALQKEIGCRKYR